MKLTPQQLAEIRRDHADMVSFAKQSGYSLDRNQMKRDQLLDHITALEATLKAINHTLITHIEEHGTKSLSDKLHELLKQEQE